MITKITLKKALGLVSSVRGKQLDTQKRAALAIELAAILLVEAQKIQTPEEKTKQEQIADMVKDPVGKAFTIEITDQCFRCKDPGRTLNQFNYIIKKYGIPSFLSKKKQLQLFLLQKFGFLCKCLSVYLTKHFLRQETSSLIISGEKKQLLNYLKRQYKKGLKINLNHLGEAILGEKEALNRLNTYIEDLQNPEISYISIKISTIFSQINLLDWEGTLDILAKRLEKLYQTAIENKDKHGKHKFVNLDMEEYRDLHMTVDLFKKVLNQPAFHHYFAGIVLQSYLPDSFHVQKELTEWAMERVKQGGAPIKVRLVKGANLAMEQLEASMEGWEQAPYTQKIEADSAFKKMMIYGLKKSHAEAVHIGIASHNLFDISYALLLTQENAVDEYVTFEMLEGMADHQRQVIQELTKSMLLYCPVAKKEEFVNAVAYLVRRLDENTAPENFLCHSFNLTPESKEWDEQANFFTRSCLNIDDVGITPRRTQNRLIHPFPISESPFVNEPNTDWSFKDNREWIYKHLSKEKSQKPFDIPLFINQRLIWNQPSTVQGQDPSRPDYTLYTYTLASKKDVDEAINAARIFTKKWQAVSSKQKSQIVANIAHLLRIYRGKLIAIMVADAGKTVKEADAEVSEAIDFCEYYRRSLMEILSHMDVGWKAKGVVLVASPWNFPCAIPLGGVVAALLTGNCVLFKPSNETLWVAWLLVNICWKGGVPKQVLQFIICEDEPTGSYLISDERINAIILTGATETARLFLKLHPGLDLIAETGGKNAMVISKLCDKDLAIKHIAESAFGHSGQKCSACSLAILDAEVYDDEHFINQLVDAVESLKVGPAWDLQTKVNPLINKPSGKLLKGLTELEEGEEWLLKPEQDPNNPNLWSPGIKKGVTIGNFTQKNELFGPVLGLIRAKDFAEAVTFANKTIYGLTSGVHTLDEREQRYWLHHIHAGNCYINRGITGAIVQRQPFGGCKQSSFGRGAKAGGPNYLTQLMRGNQKNFPPQNETLDKDLKTILTTFKSINLSDQEQEIIEQAALSYQHFWISYFSKKTDPSHIIGQDNFLIYQPTKIKLRLNENDSFADIICVILACLICRAVLEISFTNKKFDKLQKTILSSRILWKEESEKQFLSRLNRSQKLRLLSPPSKELLYHCANGAITILKEPVLQNGRFELLNYLREISISWDYHRYGNLGLRSKEYNP